MFIKLYAVVFSLFWIYCVVNTKPSANIKYTVLAELIAIGMLVPIIGRVLEIW